MSRGQVDAVRFAFACEREQGLIGPFPTPAAEAAAEARYVRDAMQDRLILEATDEIRQVVAGGRATASGPDPAGREPTAPFAELGRHDRLVLLERAIDWAGYLARGMDPDTPPLLMVNAADGKPPGRWLEETPAEAAVRQAELDDYAREFEASRKRIRHTIEAFARRAQAAAGPPEQGEHVLRR